MTVHTLKQCRPDQEETEYLWKLFHAAQRNDARWHGSEISIIADELSRTDLDRNQKLFLLRSWQVLVDDKGGFGRFMGAFDTYVYNMQDPDDDCVAWKPELSNLLCDGAIVGRGYRCLSVCSAAHSRTGGADGQPVKTQRWRSHAHERIQPGLCRGLVCW
ncbi:hypothetical protein BOW93_gp046 [Salmonella phage 118970_sal3]|uniref:hypothetical protein n=1 Tax=Salmonella phage 118970_sal3 TaxID=1813771 RepID=UPI000866454E|nr:hypothetical protein BOW93_gp046 [Salmonella phage 118970_sal3]ANM45281.2 hypothetical protein 118970sal3_00046 [Salmonella phage 118970_sal3]